MSFCWHKWQKWADWRSAILTGTDWAYELAGPTTAAELTSQEVPRRIVVTQQRKCEKCGLLQIRNVDAHF